MNKPTMTAETAMFELEPILYSIIYGLKTIGAIQTAMAEGKNDMSGYPDALYYVWSHLTEEAEAALQLINTAATRHSERERLIEELRNMPTFGEAIRQAENLEK